MATNIIEVIQQNLGYPALQKIDPNNQEIKGKHDQSSEEKLAQAAIPAVLAAVYKLSKAPGGADKILYHDKSEDWLYILFSGKEMEVVEKVAQYAGITEGQAEANMENIADEAVRIIHNDKNDSADKIKSYVKDQRHNILVYLPAVLGVGDLLNDEGLDDKTNKMEGPVSNLMHKIEDKFSGSGK